MTPDLRPELQPLERLFARIDQLETRVRELERAKVVPGVVPLTDFPSWYQSATNSPLPPVTQTQLRNWCKRPKSFGVDWIVRRGRSVWVDSEKFVAWIRRDETQRRVRVGEGFK